MFMMEWLCNFNSVIIAIKISSPTYIETPKHTRQLTYTKMQTGMCAHSIHSNMYLHTFTCSCTYTITLAQGALTEPIHTQKHQYTHWTHKKCLIWVNINIYTHRNSELLQKSKSWCKCVSQSQDLRQNSYISRLMEIWKWEPFYTFQSFQPCKNQKDNICYDTQCLKCAVNIATWC